LDRPEYCGGFEEAIRCISSLPFVDEELLKAYLNLRGKVVLFGKVGVEGKAFHHGRFPSMAQGYIPEAFCLDLQGL
jgi:hypothetical protein